MIVRRLIPLIIFASIGVSQAMAGFKPFTQFGSNPGLLSAQSISSQNPNRPIVVLLHGCGQNGTQFAQQSGWSKAATAYDFNLLVPQQNVDNNAQLCFNWFSPVDQQGNKGESQSIVNMIKAIKNRTDPSDVFIAGLSAGGAMTSNLMTFHPELFTAGAVVSGIGFPCADSLIKAISCMKHGPAEPVAQSTKVLHSVLAEKKPPLITIVVGKDDAIVAPVNSTHLAHSWKSLLKTIEVTAPIEHLATDEINRVTWVGENKTIAVELIELSQFGHGWSVNPTITLDEVVAPYLAKHNFSTTQYLLKKWKLI